MKLTPMLGENIVNHPESILDGKLWRMSEKIDGVRRLFHKDVDGTVTAWSRTNHRDIWVVHILEYLESPWFPCDRVYDCELVDRELYFKQAQSFVLRTVSNSKASQQYSTNKQDLMAICFDIFKPGGDLRRAEERDIELYSVFNRARNQDPMIRGPIFGNFYGVDMYTIRTVMETVTSRGGEGLMLLDMDSIYIPGRTNSLLKVKKMREFVGTVIDFEMARPGTKIEGMVAAIICDVPGCTIPVRVGSGFNNAERIEMVNNSPIGRQVEIEAFSYSKNKSGGISLNLPIFKQFKEAI